MTEPPLIDDDLSDEEIAQSNETAEWLFDRLIDEVNDLDEDEGDQRAIFYSLWVSLTQALALQGWTSADLCKDVEHHVNATTSEGSA